MQQGSSRRRKSEQQAGEERRITQARRDYTLRRGYAEREMDLYLDRMDDEVMLEDMLRRRR